MHSGFGKEMKAKMIFLALQIVQTVLFLNSVLLETCKADLKNITWKLKKDNFDERKIYLKKKNY